MQAFSALLALCAGNSPVTDGFPAQRQVTRGFDVFFDLRLNGWVNNREAGDLRHHCGHYDVTVMLWGVFSLDKFIIRAIQWKAASYSKIENWHIIYSVDDDIIWGSSDTARIHTASYFGHNHKHAVYSRQISAMSESLCFKMCVQKLWSAGFRKHSISTDIYLIFK